MADIELIEEIVEFSCARARLWGIVSRPPAGVPTASTAVVINVGGPQYRVGSHRQFVLLARTLARQGYATLRFDYRGMGDSEGAMQDFQAAGPDLLAAIDAMCLAWPGARSVVVWGLCDAASAALMFAATDERVAGIVAVNPWTRSDASLAAVHVKYYYASRVVQREFWIKLLRGGIDLRTSLLSFVDNLQGARAWRRKPSADQPEKAPFQTAMARGVSALRGQLLLILSGNDLTAKEFVQYTESAPEWCGLMADPKVSRIDLADADHTFSRRIWQTRVEDETVAWLKQLGKPVRRRESKTGEVS
jgi:uncharacterized protein